MADITEIETLVLEEMAENLTTADNWDGTDELREALNDAVDEACMINGYFLKKIYIPMEAYKPFYRITMNEGYPLWIHTARLLEQDRDLVQTSWQRLELDDPRHLNTVGSPRLYIPLGMKAIYLYPHTSEDGGMVELNLAYCPKHYSDSIAYRSINDSLENGLIHYGKYFLYMRTAGNEEVAMDEFAQYLEYVGATGALKAHNEAARLRALQKKGDENWPATR